MPLLSVSPNVRAALDDTGAPALADFLEAPNSAVRLSPEDDPARLSPYLMGLKRIEIDFPKYTDGRGFSQAQLLRRRYGYEGELRAVGHVLRDQVPMMVRCGFDVLDTTRADAGAIASALEAYTYAYQSAADGRQPIFAQRHAPGGRD